MGLKEEVLDMKKEVKDIKENTWFMDISHTLKVNQNRFFIMWLVTFILFIGLLGYVIYLHNDIGTETISEEYEVQQDSGDNGNNNFVNGNDNEVNNG